MSPNKKNIISKPRWLPLFFMNFSSVLNNNFLKNLACFVCVKWVAKGNESSVIMIASGLYVLPYLIFSPLGGKLSKTMLKRKIILYSKLTEIPIFLLAILGFYIQSIFLVISCIFLIGTISTLFSPSKYGLIRDIGGEKGISFGTGSLEMFTFLGVLLGTFIASVVSDHFFIPLIMLILLSVSSFCLTMTLLIKADETKPINHCEDTLNPLKFFVRSFRFAATMKGMNFLVFGLSMFWMIGSFIQMNLMVHCPKVLGMTNTQTGLVMTVAAIGIGIGCYLAGVISRGKVELGLTPIGGLGMTISLLFIYFGNPNDIIFSILVFFVALFSGIFMIPLSAYIQTNVEGRRQGDIIAYSNFTVFVLILLSAGIFGAIVAFFSTNAVFLLLIILTAFTTLLLLRYVPGMVARFKIPRF